MARNIKESHERWLATPSKNGGDHKDCKMRTVYLPPYSSNTGWNETQGTDTRNGYTVDTMGPGWGQTRMALS